MTRYLLLYQGPPTPPTASHERWPAWFGKAGDRLVDRGSPMTNGRSLHADRSTTEPAANLNGYSIIQAEDSDEALGLLRDHPYLSQGDDYSIEIYELP